MKISAVTATLFATAVSAFYINEPFTGGKTSVWTVGEPANIAWQSTSQVDPKSCSGLSLELMNGPSENAVSMFFISKSLPNTATGITWAKVAGVPTSDAYFLRLTCLGQGSQYYSSRFTINNPTGKIDDGVSDGDVVTTSPAAINVLSVAALTVSLVSSAIFMF